MRDDEQAVRKAVTFARLLVFADAFDAGILRILDPQDDRGFKLPKPRLIGIAIIRGHRLTYAEHRGRVFPFWPGRTRIEALRYLDTIRKDRR